MKTAKQASLAGKISVLALSLVAGLLASQADAQRPVDPGRRPKVSAVTQAGYEEEGEPAPEMDYNPSGTAGSSLGYSLSKNARPGTLQPIDSQPLNPQFETPQFERPQSRVTQSRMSQPRNMQPQNSQPRNLQPRNSNFENPQVAPRNTQARFGGQQRTGRPAYHVAQRNNAPAMLPAPTPIREQTLIPTPNPTRAAVHPMDNPFDDDIEMPIGGPSGGPMNGQYIDGQMMDGGDCSGGQCGGGCCNNQCCGPCFCLGPWLWDNFSVFGGVQGFKGPVDLGTNGNFGFHAGINWAFPIIDPCGIGFQIGTQGVFSDLSGTTTSSDSRTQSFTTVGLFHRPACGVGPQYGVVWDYMHDDYSRATVDLSQVRGEISLIGCRGNEIGFWTAIHTNSQSIRDTGTQVAVVEHTFQATDMYAFFYRRHFCNGGWARFSGGFTNNGDGLLGADASAPLTQCLALNTNFNYRIPNESTDAANARQESWGLTINLVWYPACTRSCGAKGPNPYRPLFGVADNTTMFIDRN